MGVEVLETVTYGAQAISAEGLRRRVVTDLDHAITHLSLIEDDPVKAVHETRRGIKRVRATARLLRAIDKSGFAREDAVLAAASARLGPIRDRHVAQHLAQKLKRWPGDMVPPPLAPQVRMMVVQSNAALLGVRVRAATWDLTEADTETLLTELDASYRLARRRWNRSAEHLETADVHRCRKALKRSTNQIIVVSDRLAESDRVVMMDELGEVMGQHHDLVLIPDADRHDQTDLEAQILDLGASVFELSPKRHAEWLRKQLM